MGQIAVLLTCHNRKDKTLACIRSLDECVIPDGYTFDIYLMDDGSVDGTENAVHRINSSVRILKGNGNLYWAGGMRKIWKYAISQNDYDGYLLLNDDVVLRKQVLTDLIYTDNYSVNKFDKSGIYVAATVEINSGVLSYGGHLIRKKLFTYSMHMLYPNHQPTMCSLANANILLVTKSVVKEIGIFDERYTHGIADYDYTLTATKLGYPLLLCKEVGGYCQNDHGNNWLNRNTNLRQRIQYLYSIKGLAYKENLYYLKKHFKQQFPYYFLMYWFKTFFPVFWDKFK